MERLWLYDFMSRARWLNYRGKILAVAFAGTHIPLIAIIVFFVARAAPNWHDALLVIGIALLATLIGTGITLLVLDHLLRPVLRTASALRTYRADRRLPDLPTGYADEVGVLMADADHTLTSLDQVVDELTYYDKLTGLPNRLRLLAALSERMAEGKPFALCVVRIVNYLAIASTFDRDTAFAVLYRVATSLANAAGLSNSTGQGQFVASLDGGLFAFTLDAGEGTEPQTCDRILAGLQSEIQAGAITIIPEIVGGTAFYPEDAADADALIGNAISALASAQEGGHAGFFSAAARDAARSRYQVEQELRRALDRNELVLHFQPVIDLGAGRVVGAEALIRWNHPQRGLVPPGLFVPIAEACGLIHPIGLWTLSEACGYMNRWVESGFTDLKVAVNLSASQFLDPTLLPLIDEQIRANRLSKGHLEIELTETAAMENHRHTMATFGQLREIGVSIAIDDFGTGYSSMSYLRRLNFDKLKIDREFVANIQETRNSQAICGALIELASGLDITVLAEGTETEDEVRYLSQQGCSLFQGFHFSKALPSDDFITLVKTMPERLAELAIPTQPARRASDRAAETVINLS